MSHRILLVEDDEDLRFLLSVSLRRAGHEVIEADSGEAALAQLEGLSDHDLVLLDIRLPGIDGFEVLQRLPRPLRTKVIAMSAHAHQEMAERAIGLGCVTYLTKPFAPSELVATVAQYATAC